MTTAQDFSQYDGKKVTITVADPEAEGGQKALEGTVDTGTEMGLLFKPKGKASLELIEASKVISVEVAPESPKKITVKALLPLKDSGARQHLVDRHGYKVSDIDPLSEVDALKFHESEVGHDGLAHNHDGKPKEAGDASAEGEADAATGETAEEPAA